MSSPITSSDFENQTPGQDLCDTFQEKLLNNGKMRTLLDYFFSDATGNFAAAFIGDFMSFLAPIGSYKAFPVVLASDVANPENGVVYVEANGQELIRTDYPDLFAYLGTTFNLSTDSDATKFRVPNLSGKFFLNRDGTYAITGTGGAATVQLTLPQLPPHSHDVNVIGNGDTDVLTKIAEKWAGGESGGGKIATGDSSLGGSAGADIRDNNPFFETDTVGGDGDPDNPAAEGHPNMPPYLTGITYIVAGYKVAGALI